MKRAAQWLLLGTAVLAALAGGCNDPAAERLVSPSRMEQGLMLVLPGIEGRSHLNRGIRDGLAAGGLQTAIRIHDWTLGPVMAVATQMWEARARRQAAELAGIIDAYKVSHPGRPVILVGHSGGGAVALFAAEALPPGQTVEGIILLGPSISPDYDLTAALRRVRGKVVSYSSHKDVAFLGGGTWVFGTMDGKHSASAGQTGFQRPPAADKDLYDTRLEEIRWSPQMQLSGHEGGHTDWADRRFVRAYVVPRINWLLRSLNRSPTTQTQPSQAGQPAAGGPAETRPAGGL